MIVPGSIAGGSFANSTSRSIETLSEIPPGLLQCAWTERWIHPFESAFGWLQKFAWANLTDGAAIGRKVFGKRWVPRDDGNMCYELLCGDWIKFDRLRLPAGLPLLQGLLTAYASQWATRLGSACAFRFCQTCLRVGFHSIFFQIDALLRCPIHGTALMDRCPHCNDPTSALALQQPAFIMPFRCTHCSRAFAEPLDPGKWIDVPERRDQIERALAPIAKWLHRLARHSPPLSEPDFPLAQLRFTRTYASESSSIVYFHIAQQLTPLQLESNYCRDAKLPLHYRYVRVQVAPQGPIPSRGQFDELRDLYTARCAIYKSIRSYLVKTHLHQHRRCCRNARCCGYVCTFRGVPEWWPSIDICPLAAAFERWRLIQESCAREVFYDDCIQQRLVTNTIDSNHALWAAKVLAEFYSCVATAYTFAVHDDADDHGYCARFRSHLALYCRLSRGRLPCWRVSRGNERAGYVTYLIVGGGDEILRQLQALGRASCERCSPRWRIRMAANAHRMGAMTEVRRRS